MHASSCKTLVWASVLHGLYWFHCLCDWLIAVLLRLSKRQPETWELNMMAQVELHTRTHTHTHTHTYTHTLSLSLTHTHSHSHTHTHTHASMYSIVHRITKASLFYTTAVAFINHIFVVACIVKGPRFELASHAWIAFTVNGFPQSKLLTLTLVGLWNELVAGSACTQF